MHSERLKALAGRAESAHQAGEHAAAVSAWRDALELLPPSARQYQVIAERITVASREQPTAPQAPTREQPPKRPTWAARAGAVGALGLLVWKFKFALGFLLTKGKLLLGGLTKAGTVFSMLLSLGVYWQLWGWKLAAGLIAAMYVHEMGHVAALRHLGIKADAPMFIPGLGAFVRMRQYPASPRENARVGLAGPIWGLAATLVCQALHLVTGAAALSAIARVSAWLNLFNLLPVWQLDGGRGFQPLSRAQRWVAAAAIGLAWAATAEGLLLVLLLAAAWQAIFAPTPGEGDRRALVEYVVLVSALSALTMIEVPGIPLH